MELFEGPHQTDEKYLHEIFLYRHAKMIDRIEDGKTYLKCPKCMEVHSFRKNPTRRCYQCCKPKCGYQIYPLAGTIMQGTKLPLWKWLDIIQLRISTRTALPSKMIAKKEKLSYTTAFRTTVRFQSYTKDDFYFETRVAADEKYFGGKLKNISKWRRIKRGIVNPLDNKTIVHGVKEVGTKKLKFTVIKKVDEETVLPIIKKLVKPGTKIDTDEAPAYDKLEKLGFPHGKVNHKEKQWVNGDDTSNPIENTWGNIGPAFTGNYRSIKRYQAYLDEYAFIHSRSDNPEMIMKDLILRMFPVINPP